MKKFPPKSDLKKVSSKSVQDEAGLTLDAIDVKLLDLVQQDATTPLASLADAVGLSNTPCWRRLQRLREAGVIKRHVALLDQGHINVGVTVIVNIRTTVHTEEWFARLRATCETIPEVVEIYRMSGDVDYLLRVVVPDIKGCDGVYKRPIAGIDLHDVSSSFAVEQIKYTTALPVKYALR